MNKYKLGNIIKKDLLKTFKNEEIRKEKFKFSKLNELFRNYSVHEYIFKHYCCYGEDNCCWIDEESGWIRLANKKVSEEKLNKRMYSSIKGIIKEIFKGEETKRTVFIAENDEIIVYAFPMRDKTKEDIFISFLKNEKINAG